MAKDQDGIYFEIGEQFFLTKLYDPESLIESVMKAMSNFHVFHRERGDHSFYPKHWTATLKKYYYVAISEVSDEMIEVRSFKRGHLGGKSGYLGVEDPVIEVPIARIQTELPEAVEKAFEICKMRDEW